MARMTRRWKRGLAIVEAALLMPLLLALLFGVLEYGWLFIRAQRLNDAARHGCRTGVTEGANNGDVDAAVDLVMSNAGMPKGTVNYVTTISCPASGCNVANVFPGNIITVRVEVPYANVDLFGIPLIPVPGNIAGECSMAKEGPP